MSLSVVDDGFEQFFRRCGDILDIVAIFLESLHDFKDRTKYIEISGCTDVSFIRGETKDCNCNFLVYFWLAAQVCPLHSASGDRFDPILERNCPPSHAVAT